MTYPTSADRAAQLMTVWTSLSVALYFDRIAEADALIARALSPREAGILHAHYDVLGPVLRQGDYETAAATIARLLDEGEAAR